MVTNRLLVRAAVSEALASVSSFDIRGSFIRMPHPLPDPVLNADLELQRKSRGASSMVR